MGDKSGIQWTDATWNPTTGCTRVSAGCDHCYAFTLHDQRHEAWKAGRFPDAPTQYHRPFSEVQLIPDRLALPLRWTKPRRIFVDSMADLFHADVPEDFIAQVFAVMGLATQHTFQILTKRPQRMARLMSSHEFVQKVNWAGEDIEGAKRALLTWPKWPLPNVWLGTSVEAQAAAYRIEFLAKTPAAVRFLSCEPLIGPLNLGRWLPGTCPNCDVPHVYYCEDPRPFPINWVIAGGESGPEFRPVDLDWVRGLRDQCVASQVPFFYKQQGGRTPKAGGRELDGRTWDEMPAVAS